MNVLQRIKRLLEDITGPCLAKVIRIGDRKFRILRLLAEGGYSFVYLVRDTSTYETFAVKKILAQTKEDSTLVRNEINIHRKFDHPNLLQLIDFSIDQTPRFEEVYLLFPAYTRGNLYEFVSKAKYTSSTSLDERTAVTLFRQVVRGVHAMHVHEPPLAHRDIKPHNVLLSHEDDAVLVDFGSTCPGRVTIQNRQQGLALQEHAEQFSSMAYRAPELWDVETGTTVTEKTDIWSLGCLLFGMFYQGMSPFECQFNSNGVPYVVDDVGYLRVISGVKFPEECTLTTQMKELIESMLQLDASKRPTAGELLQQLDAVLAGADSVTMNIAVM